jgi:hypothetical protein
MNTAPARLRLAAVALAWALAPALLTAAPAAPDKDKAPSPAEKLRAALNAPISVKIDRQPLGPAVEMLREKGKVNIVIDTATIQNTFGWLPEQSPTAVDVDLKEVKLKSALRTVLTPFGLGYAVIGDTVVVTTEEMAVARQMKQRVNVEFEKVELAQALKQLNRETGANLLLDSRAEKEAKNPVSLELEDVPLETAVRLLSEMAGLKPVRIGNTLFVTRKETANELRQDPDLGQPGPGGPVDQQEMIRRQIMEIQLKLAQPGATAPVVPAVPVPSDPVTIKGKEDPAPEKKDGDK